MRVVDVKNIDRYKFTGVVPASIGMLEAKPAYKLGWNNAVRYLWHSAEPIYFDKIRPHAKKIDHTCDRCNNAINSSAKFCEHCGAKFDN